MSVEIPVKEKTPTERRPAVRRRPTSASVAKAPPKRGWFGRQRAVDTQHRRNGRPLLFGWGDNLSLAEKDQVTSRLAAIGLSAVIALVVLLIGGALLWDYVVVANKPVLRVDNYQVSLKDYADTLSYRRAVLQAQYQQASQLSQTPTQPGQDPSQNVMAMYGAQQMQILEPQLMNLDQQLPEDLINEYLISQEAAKRGITVTPDEITAKIKSLIGYQDPTPPATDANAAGAGAAAPGTDANAASAATPAATAVPTVTEAKRNAEFNTLYRNYKRYTGGTDATIRAYVVAGLLHDKLATELQKTVPTSGPQVRARHILVKDEATANEVEQKLAAGADFADMAKEYSIDPNSKDNGGEIGWFGHGALVKPFEDAAFSQPVGVIGPPVQTNFGYHIIQVEEKADNRPYEGASLQAVQDKALPDWLAAEQKNHKIERLLTSDMVAWAYKHGHQPARTSKG